VYRDPAGALARFIMGRRPIAVGLVLAFALVAVAAIVTRGVSADFSPQALFTTFEDQRAIDEEFAEHFGKTENVALIMIEADDVLQTHVLQVVHAAALAVQDAPYAARITSITTTPIPRTGPTGELRVDAVVQGETVTDAQTAELRDAIAQSTLFGGSLVSASRRVTIVAVFLKNGYERIETLHPVVDHLQELVDALSVPDGVRVRVSGIPSIRVYVVTTMLDDQLRLIPLAMIICGVFLLFAFRWLPGMLAPNAAVGMATLLVIGGMAWASEPFNIINQMIPTLLIIIGVSDSIHLVSRYGEECAKNPDRLEAGRRTVRTMAIACFLTSTTTAVGFATLAISRTDILRRFGITAAIGVMIAYFVTIFFLPPVLTWVRTPRITRARTGRGYLEDTLVAVTRVILNRPRTTLFISSLVFFAAIAVAARVNIDTTLMETFPENTSAYDELTLLQSELDGVLPFEISFESPINGRFDDAAVLNRVDMISAWLRAQHGVLSVTSYGDVLREVWVAYTDDPTRRDEPFRSEAQVAQLASLVDSAGESPISPYVTNDRRRLRISVKLADEGSRAMLELAAALRVEIDTHLGDVDDLVVQLTGDAYSGSRGLDSLVRDMLSSLGTAFIIIFVFISILYRNLRTGLISVPANVIPLIVTMAYMTLAGINLNTATVIIFSVSIGLAVDDTIHMLSRFREEVYETYDVDRAIMMAMRGAGRAIVISSFMLVCGLAVMLTSSFRPIQLFSQLTAVTIAGCFFGDLIVLPAMLKLFWRPRKDMAHHFTNAPPSPAIDERSDTNPNPEPSAEPSAEPGVKDSANDGAHGGLA